MDGRIYLDNSATTPLDPRVADEMRPYIESDFGNASSLHRSGRVARAAVDLARKRVACLLNASEDEIIFTSGGTESDNMALLGLAESGDLQNCHLITSSIEHPAILETCSYLQRRGVEITYLPVGIDGIVDPADLEAAVRPSTRLVSIMTANNVIGTIQPIKALASVARKHGVLFHTDAVQAVGKIPMDMQELNVDLLSLSAHKLHGPKGIGALYVRRGVNVDVLIHGGGQEKGMRSGTENVPCIVGLGKAAEIADIEMADEVCRLVGLRDSIIDTVLEGIPGSYLIGHRFIRLPGHVCLGFDGREGEAIRLMLKLDDAGIEVSTGSACSSNHAGQPSHVLVAIGFDPVRARGSLRITLGRFNVEEDVNRLLSILPRALSC